MIVLAFPAAVCGLFVAGVIAWEAIQDKRRARTNDALHEPLPGETP